MRGSPRTVVALTKSKKTRDKPRNGVWVWDMAILAGSMLEELQEDGNCRLGEVGVIDMQVELQQLDMRAHPVAQTLEQGLVSLGPPERLAGTIDGRHAAPRDQH